MTYGFRPDNWPVFQAELQKRGINATDIEKIEMRPADDPAVALESRVGIGAMVRAIKPSWLAGGRYEPLRCPSRRAFNRRSPDRRCRPPHQRAARTARAKTHRVTRSKTS